MREILYRCQWCDLLCEPISVRWHEDGHTRNLAASSCCNYALDTITSFRCDECGNYFYPWELDDETVCCSTCTGPSFRPGQETPKNYQP